MPTIQIKNVPPGVYRILCRQATAAGESLEEYLLGWLQEQAQEATLDEISDRAEGGAPGSVGLDFATETVRIDRARTA